MAAQAIPTGRRTLRRAPVTAATRRFVVFGLIAFVAVAVGCVLSADHVTGRWWPLGVLLGLCAAAWALVLLLRPADPRLALAGYVVFGLAGCGVDLVQPSGPAFVLGYMALAGMGLALPRLPALVGGAVVLAALTATEAVTSDQPGAAALAAGLGAVFLFLAAQFAALSRDAQRRSAELVVQTRRERAAREESAALAERSRLARELHDVLAHTLSGLALQLEATRLYATRQQVDPALVDQITVAHKLARQGMTGAKQAIAALRGGGAPGLDEVPQLVEDFRRSTGLPAELTVTGTPRVLTSAQGLAAYRMVQEALSNIAKHAPDAARVPVRIEWKDDAMSVRVCNFRPDAANLIVGGVEKSPPASGDGPAPAGFGLTGIAERAAILGGSVTFGPTGDGFAVGLTLPVALAAQTAGAS